MRPAFHAPMPGVICKFRQQGQPAMGETYPQGSSGPAIRGFSTRSIAVAGVALGAPSPFECQRRPRHICWRLIESARTLFLIAAALKSHGCSMVRGSTTKIARTPKLAQLKQGLMATGNGVKFGSYRCIHQYFEHSEPGDEARANGGIVGEQDHVSEVLRRSHSAASW